MPKIANYMRDGLKAKTVAVLWVNNDFGKGGRDNFVKEMAARGIKVVADVSTESGQVDFAADVVKVKAANADAIFVYTNEEESARIPARGAQAGPQRAADRRDHAARPEGDRPRRRCRQRRARPCRLTADAPVPAVLEFKKKFSKRFNYVPDHNGIKGYTGVYAIKYATEKIGKFDRKRSPRRCTA